MESAHSLVASSQPNVPGSPGREAEGAGFHIDINTLLEHNSDPEMTEVDRYKDSVAQIRLSDSPLPWWSKRAEDFPFLASLAKVHSRVLCSLSLTAVEVFGVPSKLCACRETVFRRQQGCFNPADEVEPRCS